MSKKYTVWVLADDRAGNVSQCLGVAEALGQNFIRKDIAYGFLGNLPNFILGASLKGLTAETACSICAPWPDLVIAAGRRSAPVARYIKNASKGQTRLVQIMHPGFGGASQFDLICTPIHDAKLLSSNEISMIGAPHRVTDQKLSEAALQWQPKFANLPRPLIGLIVGGATKNKEFTTQMAAELGKTVNQLAREKGASVLVTTSRRTGESADALFEEITQPCFAFKWGDEGENPYFGFLALSDILIVTGDSVSMCSEACSTGKPVYIYAPEGMISEKHSRMVTSLCEGGYARKFEGNFNEPKIKKLQTTLDIAVNIHKMMKAIS